MQVPEPTRLVSPLARKRQFIERDRAEKEARRKEESRHASAEPTKVTAQVCAASQILSKASLLCIQHILEVHPERDGDWLRGAVRPALLQHPRRQNVPGPSTHHYLVPTHGLALQGRAARRQDDSNATRRASNAAASTSGASHSSSSRRAAPASASRQAPKQAQPASMPRAGLPSGNSTPRLSGVVALNGAASAQAGQAAGQPPASLHPEEQARVSQALEYKAFGGTATSKTKPGTGYMERYRQQATLKQRIEDERRLSTGVAQHEEYAKDILPGFPPDFPADLQRAAVAARQELRQLQPVGASQTAASTQQVAVRSAGGHARQPLYVANESVRSQGGFGGSGFSSQGSWPQVTSRCQAEYSSGSSSMLEPAQVPLPQPGCCLRLLLPCGISFGV